MEAAGCGTCLKLERPANSSTSSPRKSAPTTSETQATLSRKSVVLALEVAGVIFIGQSDEGRGVRLREGA